MQNRTFKRVKKVIPLRSFKRRLLEDEYIQVKKEKEIRLKESNQWKCYFSNEKFDIDDKPDWHHLAGRQGTHNDVPLLIYEPYIVPVKRKYHRMWHDRPIDVIAKQYWFDRFKEKLSNDEFLFNKLCLKLSKQKASI